MKLMAGTAVGTAGVGTAAGASEDEIDVTTDDQGNSQWVVRFEGIKQLADGDVDVDDAKELAEASQQSAFETLSSHDSYTVKKQFWLANGMLVSAEKAPTRAQNELSQLAGVRDVHPNVEVPEPEPVEKQELIPQEHDIEQYGIPQINASDVWEQYGTKGDGASVAVLDTGIDASHPDLELAEDGWAFFDSDGNQVDAEPFDPNGHGTHVSGTVSAGKAAGLESNAHIGVAPDVDLYNGKVLDNGGTFAQIIAGMEWAVENGVDVINMSLGATGFFDVFIEPVQNAHEQGTIVVTSAGNSGEGLSGSPGNIYDSFSIGASNINRGIAGFSSGELVTTSEDWSAWWLTEDWPINYYVPDISAPGVSVLSTIPGPSYARFSGTSMASPHTAGAVALFLSANPGMKGDIEGIKQHFMETAIHGEGPEATPGTRYGEGIIDVLSAITKAQGGNTVEGQVTDADGNAVPGITVQSDFGNWAETDSNGEFSLMVDDGDWQLSTTDFGYAVGTATVSVSGGETTQADITLEDELAVELLQGQPDVIGQGEAAQIVINAANLEAVTVSLGGGSDLGADEVTVTLGETELTLGETLTLPEPLSGQAALVVQVADDATLGQLELDHEFNGPAGPIAVTTGASTVMEDPDDASVEITQWSENTEVAMGNSLDLSVTVENTGDRTAIRPIQWYLGSPEGPNVFTAGVPELEGGQQTQLEFSILIPAAFAPPGTQIPHGWITGDDQVQTPVMVKGPLFQFTNVDVPDQVDYGDTITMNATLQNVDAPGTMAGADSVTMFFAGTFMGSTAIEGEVGSTAEVTFEVDSTEVVRNRYNYQLASNWDSREGSLWVGEKQGPPAIGNNAPPTDPDGDGLYEDTNGDEKLDIFDVQTLFNNLDNPAVQNNAEFYNFSDQSPADEVTIFDVQALMQEVQN